MAYLFSAPLLKGSYWVSQEFGENPARYPCCGGHEGIDLAAPSGTPVYAPADGVVSEVYHSSYGAYGIHVKMDHYIGFHPYPTILAHFVRGVTSIKKGDMIKSGQLVGYVGTTGNSTGNHLHYTIIDVASNKYLDPKPITDWDHTGETVKTGNYLRASFTLNVRETPSLRNVPVGAIRAGDYVEFSNDEQIIEGYLWGKLTKQDILEKLPSGLLSGKYINGEGLWVAKAKVTISRDEYFT